MKTLPIITTYSRCRHNPGDTFIGAGLQYVCEEIADKALPWQIISKFKVDQLTEAIPDMKKARLVFYAGTPQYNNYSKWKFHYDDELWSEIINPNGISVAAVAGGSGEPDPTVTATEWATTLSSDPTTVSIIQQRTEYAKCFTVRDQHSHELLNKLDIENALIPCTAVFAGDYCNIQYEPAGNRVAVTTQGIDPNDEAANERAGLYVGIAKALRDQGHDPVITCHERNEFDVLKRLAVDVPVFYTNDYYSLLKFYGTCEGVVSARLHGSLPAWGIGVERIVNISLDSRGYAASEVGIMNMLFDDVSPPAIAAAYTSPVAEVECGSRKVNILEQYRSVLEPLLEEWDAA